MIMGVLVWGLLVLVVFPLLQMPVIIYIARHIESREESPHSVHRYWTESGRSRSTRSFESKGKSESGSEGKSESESEGESSEKTDLSTITCPHCGTENDSDFTYCRNCIEKLPLVRRRDKS
jgi:hypothetical protein